MDIAFYCEGESLATYETFLLAQELATELNREVDLVNIREASTVFQSQIFSNGHVMYAKDDVVRMRVQMKVMSMYAKLNEEREIILEEINKRGTIYEK
nr:nucleotidyltransferase domain-containing protein [Shouchella shacheensis]